MAATQSNIIPAGQRQLFFDDLDLAGMQNLQRQMHQPNKKGAAIWPDLIKGGAPQIRTGPAWDPAAGLFKIWDFTASSDLMYSAGYHESRDGVHWTQPNGGQGSQANVSFDLADGHTLGPHSVVYDPAETNPDRRFKALSYHRGQNQMVASASPDGIQWQRLDVPPIPSYDEFNLSLDPGPHQFIATVKVRGPYGRSHALTTSYDFEHWTEPGLVFHADDLDQELARTNIEQRLANPMLQQPLSVEPAEFAADIYNFAVSRYESRYIGFPALFHHTGRDPSGRNHDGFHLIQFTSSTDMRHWQRQGDRQPFIGPSPLGAGASDLMQLLPPSFPVLRGDQLWFYYTGLKRRVSPAWADPDQGGICLATLRRDGFISLNAGVEDGAVTTRPLQFAGKALYINGHITAAGGEIACELLDANGNPIPGFTRQDCTVFTGDNVGHQITWGGSTTLPSTAGAPLAVRFYLRQANLYSYWCA